MISPKTIVITGATDGLGKAVASELARQARSSQAGTSQARSSQEAVRLILHGRNDQRLELLRKELDAQPAEVVTVRADLAEMSQVHALADDISSKTDHVSVLVNNAGVGAGEPDGTTRSLTADGNELRFAVNYLAAFCLTNRLLPLLDKGAPSRVVNVASIGQAPIAFDDLTLQHGYDGQRAYGQSKLAMITAGMALAERLDPSRITVNSLHPGTYMPTKMVMQSIGHSVDSLDTGVRSTLRLINDPELAGVTGRFFDRTSEARAHADAYRPEVRDRLWDISEKLTSSSLR